MSTRSSPRPSIASSRARSPTPTSPGRPSIEPLNTNIASSSLSTASTPSTIRAVSPSVHTRRNRAALRDYYNLRPPQADSGTYRSRSIPRSIVDGQHEASTTTATFVPTGTELDNPDFDPQRYVDQLLATSSLSTVLKAENTLVGDIRTLDGERKALVYDNYSKLIRAVETIGKMRRSMDERGTPLTMTKTLGPAIAFVAETAGGLIQEGEEQRRQIKEAKNSEEDRRRRRAEKETVKWVLAAPDRLKKLLEEGKREEAEKDWEEVRGLLDRWNGVKGVTEIRNACVKAMESKSDGGS